MSMRKYWVVIFAVVVVVVGDLVLGFFVDGESGEVGDAVGRMMIGDGVISAVAGVGIWAVVCSVWTAIGGVSSNLGCQRAGVGLVAAVGWRGHSPAEDAGCLLLSVLFL